MNKFLTLTEAQRRTVFEQTATRIKLPVASIEKDFWVTEILNTLFSLPYADRMVFKGGTSLSKVWGIIRRFSEDIDIAIDRSMFGIEGDVTKKQLKKLRKASSVFVRDTLANDLISAAEQAGLSGFVTIKADSDGEGDATYPEPRKVHIFYKSVLPSGTNSKRRFYCMNCSRPTDAGTPTANRDTFMTYARCLRPGLPTGLFPMMNYGKPYAIIGRSSLQYAMWTIHRMFVGGLSSFLPKAS